MTCGYVHEKRETPLHAGGGGPRPGLRQPAADGSSRPPGFAPVFPPTGTRTPAVPPCRMPGQLRLRTFRRSVSRLTPVGRWSATRGRRTGRRLFPPTHRSGRAGEDSRRVRSGVTAAEVEEAGEELSSALTGGTRPRRARFLLSLKHQARQLTLGVREARKLAGLAAEWLRRGVSAGDLRLALSSALPAEGVRTAFGFLAHRLVEKLPPRPEEVAESTSPPPSAPLPLPSSPATDPVRSTCSGQRTCRGSLPAGPVTVRSNAPRRS